jgi:hypothetical protein
MKNLYLLKFVLSLLFLGIFSMAQAALSVTTHVTANVSCNGGNNGSINANACGGVIPYTYAWSTGATTSTIIGLTVGTYTLTVTDNSAVTVTASATITQPCVLNVTANVLSNVTCYGLNNGVAAAARTGGTSPYTYLWSNGGTLQTQFGLSGGSYTVTITDSCGATASAMAIIMAPGLALTATPSALFSPSCMGRSDQLFSNVSGGTPPWTYSWAPNIGLNCSNCANPIAYPYGTTYTLIATDNNGCIATGTVSVTLLPYEYTAVTGPLNPVCASVNDTLRASGGTSYKWSTGATTSSIIVSPSVSTTYTVAGTNSYGCVDTVSYFININCGGNGNSSSTPISITPGNTCNPGSYSTLDSVVWYTFTAGNSNVQIIADGNPEGIAVPHVHRLTLYDNSLNIVQDRALPDITGANEIRIDASPLTTGNVYYVRVARTPSHSNTPGCNPTPSPTGVCNATQRWSFQICFRNVPTFIPDDSGSEAPSMAQLYYENRGQIESDNIIP